jgi:hypothetical protein
MNTSSDIKIEKPKIISALLSGFNTVASKPYLIFLPVIVDLVLWFGPIWRVDSYFKPLLQSLSDIPGLDVPEYAGLIQEYQVQYQQVLENFNLATTLRTIPIGVPSLMIAKAPFLNPVGRPLTINLRTGFQVFGFWLVFLLLGFFLGSIYYQNISHQVVDDNKDKKFNSLMNSYIQIIMIPILLVIIFAILSIPLVFIITLLTVISPGFGEFALLIAGGIILWIIMPLIFTPHGIFLFKQNLIAAMMTSISVVRVSMGKTLGFILLSLLLIQGLDYLWQTPPVDNWLLIVGILGHAFIVTAIIAASFHFFIDATKFTQTIMNNRLKSVK